MAEGNKKQDGNGNQGVSGNGKTTVATLLEKAKAGARLLMGQVQEDAQALKKPRKLSFGSPCSGSSTTRRRVAGRWAC